MKKSQKHQTQLSKKTDTAPKEGDTVQLSDGNRRIYKNGRWVIQIASNPHTGNY